MPEEHRRTQLPPAEAEGAGNFAAEPDTDPTADSAPGGPPEDVEIRSETATLTQPEQTSAEGDTGNVTGGEPPELEAQRRADSKAEEARMEQARRERVQELDGGESTRSV